MKTTLEISDDLLIEAKSIALRRHTTLRAIVEHALMREIRHLEPTSASGNDFMEISADGMPLLKRRGGGVTDKKIRQIRDNEGI